MNISSILSPNGVILSLRSCSKKPIFEELAQKSSEVYGHLASDIFDVLIDREKLGSTVLGNGVAIPHGKIEKINKISIIFARSQYPIEFDTIDKYLVDLFCMLIVPKESGSEDFKAISCISRILRNETLCRQLRHANSVHTIYDLLTKKL